MLVLTRKLMEKLFIGDDICVTVVRLEGGQVRLGIDAPREVAVVRAELVPERAAARPRSAGAGNSHSRPAPAPHPHLHGELRTQPPLLAHGTDNRRRGRSR
jgi:carbon storage regulator